MTIRFRVAGAPRPKGNLVARCHRKCPLGARPVVMEDNTKPKSGNPSRAEKLRKWTSAAHIAQRPVAPVAPFSGAVMVKVAFELERPASRRKDPFPVKRRDGDLDKMLRALLDAIQASMKKPGLIIVDDSQVCKIVAEKRWAKPGEPGTTCEIVPMEAEQEKLI